MYPARVGLARAASARATGRNASSALLPSPLWGGSARSAGVGVGVGGRDPVLLLRPPPPTPPHKGGGSTPSAGRLAKSFAREFCPFAKRGELAECNIARHRCHAAMRAGGNGFFGKIPCRLGDDGGDLIRRLDLLIRHIDRTNLHRLAIEQFQQADRNTGVAAFDRNLPDPAFGERGKNFLILPPFVAERRLPIDVGLDAVAVANVYGGGAGQALDGAMQRTDAPRFHLAPITL